MSKTHSAKYLGEAQELAAKVANRVDEIDEGRQIPTDLFRDMADAGFFKLLVPESLGGAEMQPLVFFEIIRIFAQCAQFVAIQLGHLCHIACPDIAIAETSGTFDRGRREAAYPDGRMRLLNRPRREPGILNLEIF